ncbi:MAG: type I 3-dehydroquinate dehydratase [Desulfurococcales archaeon]|nr:type I 3-dehydroquinate dehydratase [Desulfurococcales archaeon]
MALGLLEKVCTVIAASSIKEALLKASSSPTKCVELRLDYLPEGSLKDSPRLVSALKKRGFRVVSTVRSRGEGGASDLASGEIAGLYRALIEAGSDHVDLEYRRFDRRFLEEFAGIGILSLHSYSPSRKDLEDAEVLVEDAGRYGMLAKIALVIDDSDTLSRLIRLAGERVTIVGMGRYSLISRVLSLLRGSSLTFAAHPEGPRVAPGQPLPRDIIEVYRLVKSSCGALP